MEFELMYMSICRRHNVNQKMHNSSRFLSNNISALIIKNTLYVNRLLREWSKSTPNLFPENLYHFIHIQNMDFVSPDMAIYLGTL